MNERPHTSRLISVVTTPAGWTGTKAFEGEIGSDPLRICSLRARVDSRLGSSLFSTTRTARAELSSSFIDKLSLTLTVQATMEVHWGKHHRAYVDNLNKQIKGGPLDSKSLEEVGQ